MKTNLFKSFGAIIIASIVLFSCKKSNDDKPETQYQAPAVASNIQVVEVPAKLLQSEDPYANMAAGFMSMANAFSGYSSYFTVPNNATQSRTKTSGTIYTWSYGGTTVKLTFDEDATHKYWVWYINNVKFMDCKESIVGKTGSFTVYDFEHGGGAVLVYNWAQTSTTVSATMKLIDGSDSFFFKISGSLDGKSGTFDLYEGTSEAGNHIVNVTWLSNGSGTWWIKIDSQTYSGSWTA